MTPKKKTLKDTKEKPVTHVSDEKKALVKEIAEKMKSSRTVLLASCKGLPGQQFHEIKKKFRGQAELKVAKKSIVIRAIDAIEKGAIKNLKKEVQADCVLLFSEIEPFELSAMLSENQSSRKAKPGDVAPEDIEIEPGHTDLPPGPAISELSGVGLKVAVKEGKLEIIKGNKVVKKGEEIKANVASVLTKLNVFPIKVGFLPLAAYDANVDAVYTGIIIDKEGTLEVLRDSIRKSLGFATSVKYPTAETIRYFIAKASLEEKAIAKLLNKPDETQEEKAEEKDESNVEPTTIEIQADNVQEGGNAE